MFKKLLSNLPFNPSLIDQVAFYASRLSRENSIRRLGFGFMSLALVVQIFAYVAPPEATLARSGNDIIEGGFGSKEEAVGLCHNNTANFGKILEHFNISCDNLSSAETVTLKSTDYNKQLYSMGRIAYGKAGETPIDVNGVGRLWLRYLWAWDSTAFGSSYKALKGISNDGQTFMILYNCGNLVFIGLPPPPTPKCEWNPNILSTDPKCYEPCPVSGKHDLPKNSAQCFEPCPVSGKQHLPANDAQCFEPCPVSSKENISKDSLQCFEPCPYNENIADGDPACKPCESSQTRDDQTACLVLRKTVRNDTRDIEDANGTTAKSGEVLSYTLFATNQGKGQINDFVVQENISDILDYGDIESLNGGELSDSGIISWQAVTINANETIERRFSVKVKSPIPATPASSSDPGHFDLTMTNVYGNTTEVKLPTTPAKTAETLGKSLPQTGPGSGLLISFGLLFFVGYFYARTRLMQQELVIIKSEYLTGTGE